MSSKAPEKPRKTSRKKASGGARKANQNHRIHGGYSKLTDGRRRDVKMMRQVQAALATALGDDLSPQQVLLVQNTSVLAIRVKLMGSEILRLNGDVPERLSQDYLRYSRELRSNLQVLGLERKQRDVGTLETYIAENYGGDSDE